MKIPTEIAEGVSAAVATTGNVTQAGSVAVNLGFAPLTVEDKGGGARAPKASPPSPSAGVNPRVYIQYSEPEQSTAVSELVSKLAGSQLRGRVVAVPAPELVRSSVSQHQLRCFRRADCEQVRELAGYISALIGEPVTPRDLSSTYERRTSARPLHYELWLAAKPFAVQKPAAG